MEKPKVVLVVVDRDDVPKWVFPELDELGVEFVAKNCRTREEFLELAGDAFLVWTMGVCGHITADVLPQLRNCRYIMRSGSGLDTLPVKEAAERGIEVTNTPEAIAGAVAEHAVGLIFALARQIPRYHQGVRAGEWRLREDWDTWRLAGRTLGLVGFGCIARKVARYMSGLDVTVLCHDPYQSPDVMKAQGVIPTGFDRLLAESDFLSVHCPLTESTRHLFGEAEFRKMKPSALLVNTSRGAVVDEPALIRALREGQISGAALDVTEQEPIAADNPLLSLDNVIVTPHIAAFNDAFQEDFWRGSVARIAELVKTPS